MRTGKGWLGLALSLMLLVLGGCDVSAPSDAASTQPSKYSLDRVFKDPKAQALALAAEQGRTAEVQRLIKQEHVDPDTIFADDDSGMPVLAWPIFTLNPAGLKAMLDNGANPNARKPGQHSEHYPDGSGGTFNNYDTAMVWAAKQEDPIYLKLLLDRGGNPNDHNLDGETLLFQALIWHDQWKNVQLLVERGANVNGIAGMGVSVLSHYTSFADFDKAYWLLQHGADPAETDLLRQPTSPAPPRHLIMEDIFWYPPKEPMVEWQRKCQQWLLQHGYQRPPISEYYRKLRMDFHLPYEEKDIPLL